MAIIPVRPEDCREPLLETYQRADGSWVAHIDTDWREEDEDGPLLTVYINDDTDLPVYDNRKEKY